MSQSRDLATPSIGRSPRCRGRRGPIAVKGPRRHVSSPYFGDRSASAALDVMSRSSLAFYSSNKRVKDASKAANSARGVLRNHAAPRDRDPDGVGKEPKRPVRTSAPAFGPPGESRPASPLPDETAPLAAQACPNDASDEHDE